MGAIVFVLNQAHSASFAAPCTVVVAAADTLDGRAAQFRCDGTDDQNTIDAALALLSTFGGSGKVLLLLASTTSPTRSSSRSPAPRSEEKFWGFWENCAHNGDLGPATGIGGGVSKIKASAPEPVWS